MRNYSKIYDRKSMSCNAVLITQFDFSDFEAPTQLCSNGIHVNNVLTEPHRIDVKSLYQVAASHMPCTSCIMHVFVPVYNLDLNRLLSKPPLTADVGGRYLSSSAVLSHDMSPRTWLRSVIPQSLMAVSSSSFNTAQSLAYTHRSSTSTTYYPHNTPRPPCRT
jgi:hypothetical protein